MSAAVRHIAAVGVFDGVHAGHRRLLAAMRAMAGDGCVHVFTFTDHPMRVIAPHAAPRLITPPGLKLRMLDEAGADEVTVLEFGAIRHQTAREFMDMLAGLGVTDLLLGFNNRFGCDRLKSVDDYRAIGVPLGIEVSQAGPLIVGGAPVSSTRVRALVAEGDIAGANALLGTRLTLAGRVGDGKRLGRTIGYPTANIKTDERQLLPAVGVYAATADVDGRCYPVMVNIGTRPTVDDSPEITVEAHLIGYDGDLYGRELSLRPIERIRPVERFGSLDELRARLDDDRLRVLAICSATGHLPV